MITQNIKKLKKYLFYISIIFFLITTAHLSYAYLHSNSKISPVKWWTVLEAIIWKVPTLNPILPSYSDWNDKYINQLLYRSLLKYDIDEQKIVWDITNCDITSLTNIECIINEDAKWSNWEKITAEDILTTYQLIRETGSNKTLVSLLADTEIESRDNVVVFKNKVSDVNFLNVFFQPILNKKVIDKLSNENITWNFPILDWIYSWKFVVEKAVEDEILWISKLYLSKNQFYDKSNISKIILNIFPDINSFKKNSQAINVFNDSENNIWNSIYRLESHKYISNSFVWLYLNQNTIINPNLRTYILNKIDNEKLINLLWKENFQSIKNPFLTDETISREAYNKNFDSVMSSIWFKKKSFYMKDIVPEKEKKVESWEQKVETETEKKELIIPEDLSIDRYQKDSKTIISPEYVDIYNFITKDDTLLTWKAGENVEAVYINEQKLTNYSKWKENFYYKLKESFWSLKPWVNTYKIYFEINWKKELQEELTFVYYNDKNTLEKAKKDLAINIFKKEFEKNNENLSEKVVKNEDVDPTKDRFEKLNSLDENFYYNDKLVEYTLKLAYINDSKKETIDTVNFIENSLKELWIKVESKPVELKDLSWILSNKDSYDMILAGVHLWYTKNNLFPYFHSSQVKSWYNFSNIRKTSLDLNLEELKSWIPNEERRKFLSKKILDILKEEQIMKPLYTWKINLLIDKSIKLNKEYKNIPFKSDRISILENIYVKESVSLNFQWKSFSWFFKYLAKKLYE